MEKWQPVEPTSEEEAQRRQFVISLSDGINLHAHNGVSVAVILSGLEEAICDLITCSYGRAAVPAWFRSRADRFEELVAEAEAEEGEND